MIKQLLFAALLLGGVTGINAQTLKPGIGLSTLPADSDSVCTIPVYTGDFNSSGLQAGDTIPHFKLFDANGSATDVLTVLQTGKPLLLIAGSYTCPVFRQKIARINQVASAYGSQVSIYVIYTVEAHPNSPEPSPYSGTVWVTSENQQEGVLYLQPKTYGERKQVLSDMVANPLYALSVPVLLDGPCNEWWLNFGPAPNNAYIINPDGTVYKKHGWFDKNPDNIADDLNSLLLSVSELPGSAPGVYPNPASEAVTFNLESYTGTAGITILDATGKEAHSSLIEAGDKYEMNVSGLAKGFYIYKVRVSDKVITGKILIR